MNNVCLCIGKYAKNPFYVRLSDISLYSVEELCYYFMENVHMVDESMFTLELVGWLRNECGLAELADELEIYVRKHVSAHVFVTVILEKTGMYDEATIKQIERALKEQSNLTVEERYKKRAQYLYGQGRFRQALSIYEDLMDYLPSRDDAGRALIYYNMASIYAMDFAYSQAAELYYQSYLLRADRQTRVAYILAKKMSLTDYAYGSFKREKPEWEQDFLRVEDLLGQTRKKWQESKEKAVACEIMELKASGKSDVYRKRMGELTEQLKKDYRRQTKE